jgi:hypothetical protein
VRVAIDDPDERLIAAMLAPPPLEQAQSSLEFWRRRRSRLPFYRRRARREADEMIGRWHECVLEAERSRYGTGVLGLVRRLFAGDSPSWKLTGVGLTALVWGLLPRRLLFLAGAVAMLWLLVVVLTLVAIAYMLA